MCLCVPVCIPVYVVTQRSQNGGSDKCVRGTRPRPQEQGASYVFAAGAGVGGGHSSSIWEVRKKDN